MKILTKKELLEAITQAINKERCSVKYKPLQLPSYKYLQVINDNIDTIYNTYKDVISNPKDVIEPHWSYDELGYYDIAYINFKENSIERKLRYIDSIKFHFSLDQLIFIRLDIKEPRHSIELNYGSDDWYFDLMHYSFRLLDTELLKEKYPNFKTLDDLSVKIKNNWNI